MQEEYHLFSSIECILDIIRIPTLLRSVGFQTRYLDCNRLKRPQPRPITLIGPQESKV